MKEKFKEQKMWRKGQISFSLLPPPPAHPSRALLPVNSVTEDFSLLEEDGELPPSWSRTQRISYTFITPHHRLVSGAETQGLQGLQSVPSTILTQRSHFHQQVPGVKHLQIFTSYRKGLQTQWLHFQGKLSLGVFSRISWRKIIALASFWCFQEMQRAAELLF